MDIQNARECPLNAALAVLSKRYTHSNKQKPKPNDRSQKIRLTIAPKASTISEQVCINASCYRYDGHGEMAELV